MKIRHIHKIALVVSLAVLAACGKKLDVAPGTQISPDQIQTEGDVQAVLLGCYQNLQDPNSFGERFLLIPDLVATNGEEAFQGTFLNYRQYQLHTQLKTSDIAEAIWARSFATINNANIVLGKLDKVSSANRAAIGAEAKFIRGTVYFMLSGLYGKPYSAGSATTDLAVPLVLDPIIGQADLAKGYVARATVDAVQAQAIKDLTDAVAGLPAEQSNGRADKFAAYAFLSRIYLAQGKYNEAAAVADSVITNGHFQLTSSFDKAFNNATNSSEDIFAIQQTNQSNAGTSNNGLQTFYAGRSFGGRGDIPVNMDKIDGFEDTDVRKGFTYEDYGINVGDGFYTNKWKQQYKVIPVVRLAEMYLTRAEANLRAGTAVGATPLSDVNLIRQRSGASAWTAVTADDVVAERLRELAFEGDKFWTLKRLKKNFGQLDYLDNKLVFPVPQREIDANSKLTQNPGY
ncbi:RagB/SusD family nutrient uptake outer membrane protein [Chitinophaga vietnamensis]|uniref:RagB/SusD family nutrient uptake outer membrane protein n=1 Tax=Chitinophaga vietnamensis TaxID=2593957 RepID=UPI001178446D|nr:RagB/SusD family nutrient uptake outer membrane protein [Chitinophaga vietnamensis]